MTAINTIRPSLVSTSSHPNIGIYPNYVSVDALSRLTETNRARSDSWLKIMSDVVHITESPALPDGMRGVVLGSGHIQNIGKVVGGKLLTLTRIVTLRT